MNKTIMFLGMLAVSFANAQQKDPYDGKVGVNTHQPSATLNVKSKTGNTKDTKNFELENADGTKMITVLDNGNVGINKVDPRGILDAYGTSIFRPKTENDAVWILSNPKVGGASGLIHTQIAPELANAREIYSGFKEFTTITGFSDNALYKLSFIPKLSAINNNKSLLTIHGSSGNVGIGEMLKPEEKLHISEGKVRINDLPNTFGTDTDKVVVVDNKGILKSIDRNSIGSSVNENEWVYEGSTKRVNLRRSGQDQEFTNKVFYDENGRNINIDAVSVMRESDENIISDIVEQGSSFNVSHLKADRITYNYPNLYYYYAAKDESFFQVNDESLLKTGHEKHFTNQKSHIYTDPNSDQSLASLMGSANYAIHRGSGQVTNAIFGTAGIAIAKNGPVKKIVGAYGNGLVHTNSKIEGVNGFNAFNTLGKSNENITLDVSNSNGIDSWNEIRSGGRIVNMSVLHGSNIINPKVSNPIDIDNIYGMFYEGLKNISKIIPSIKSHYGLMISNITGAQNNYAIYTNKGKVHLGDEVEVKGSIKVASTTTNDTCTQDKAGTIRFKDNKFQGCTGSEWKDLHN